MQVEEAFGDGVKHLLGERLDKAEASFSRAADLDPDNAAIQFKLAEVLAKLNKLTEAEQHVQKAVALDDKNPYYYQLLASVLRSQGKVKEVVKVWQRLIKKYPKEADYYYPLAEAYLNQKKNKDAIEVLNQLEKQVGRNPELTRQKQQILLRDNKLKEAIAEGEALIKTMPDEPDFMLALAEILATNNQTDEAITWLLKARGLDPANGYVSLLLYQLYRQKGNKAEAEKELDQALKDPDVNIDDKVQLLRPYLNTEGDAAKLAQGTTYAQFVATAHPMEAKAFALLGDFYNLADKKREARDTYVKSAYLPGTTLQVWQEIIRLDAELEQVDSVAKHAGMAAELFPTQPLIWLYKGRANFFLKKYADATEALNMAAKLANGNNALQVEAYSMMGDAYNSLKDYVKSDDAYQKVLKLEPDNTYVLNNYSYFLALRKDKLAQARQMCERLVKLKPNDASNLDTYGWVLFQLKEYKEAAMVLEKAANDKNASAVILEHYGDALFKLGQPQDALVWWKKAKEKGGDASPLLDKKISSRSYVE